MTTAPSHRTAPNEKCPATGASHMRALALAIALPVALGGCAAATRSPCNPLKGECVIGEERLSAVMKPFPKPPFLNK